MRQKTAGSESFNTTGCEKYVVCIHLSNQLGSRMPIHQDKLARLRQVITESLRVQRGGETIDYINVGTALNDACARQNHAVFARRGCGKTLLLHHSARTLQSNITAVYLNCEDFKRHSFPNVLIEILRSLFQEIEKNLTGWFGKSRKSRRIVQDIILKLSELQSSADRQEEQIRATTTSSSESKGGALVKGKTTSLTAELSASKGSQRKEEMERSFHVHREKLQELDRWLPELKEQIRAFFELSSSVKCIFLQIDDLYHLRRTDQAFVVDYIHRLCKDVPLFFKIATMRHASTLYSDRDGQPIGAQERHDYQPINIDYTFNDFKKTERQNWEILEKFGQKAGMGKLEVSELFKGEGFARLVMAGGGVPRDVLSLFLEVLGNVDTIKGERIGKDDVRILSRANFERRIQELKQDSRTEEQDELLKGIYIIRKFCLDRKTNVFVVEERMLQQNDEWQALFYRLVDYRIVHRCATALTHKSQEGTYQALAIDIGCYAHLRKLQDRFNEVDVSSRDAKERMRSAPVLDEQILSNITLSTPQNIEAALLEDPS